MITVRFATGFSVQYNEAGYVERYPAYSDLYESSKKTRWIAQIPMECLIELTTPCRTYNPIATDSDKVQASVDLLAKEVKALTRKLNKLAAGDK